MTIYKQAVELRSDGRPRIELVPGHRVVDRWRRPPDRPRGKIKGWSPASSKRLSIKTLNAACQFQSHVTLTYHALTQAWESNQG